MIAIDKEVEEIVDFVIAQSEGLYHNLQRPQIESFIEMHIGFHTLMVVRSDGKIIGVCRWNWIDNHSVNILDLIIHKNFRRKSVMKSMLVNGLIEYPWIKTMKFSRKKYNHRETSIMVKDFFGGNYGRRN